jgi:hypothetical protein
MKPEMLAVRAVNQYRRRDMLAYIGLRYYLENEAAKRDVWANTVSTYLVDNRSAPIYFRSHHFKEISDQDNIVHRIIYVPGPNEILAEAALLYECSLHSAFSSLSCVYSYHFPESHSKEGVFSSYFPRYKSRHQAIAEACIGLGGATVRYTDIRKYYPSIKKELALDAWKSACDSSKISLATRELGERLLEDHFVVSSVHGDGLSILTGPMFSHLIANLVLFKIDKTMQEKMARKYWRYVDDIVLVGDDSQVNEGREFLKSILSDLGFSLHEENKDFAVDSKTWLEGVNDFNDSESELWINLISNIKRFLIARPELRVDLIKAFLDNGINIPLLDYSAAVLEASYVEKISDFLRKYPWFPKSVRRLTVQKLVKDAIQVRNVYQGKINAILDGDPQVKEYKRKRLLPKLRFYATRLSYVATPESLSSVGLALADYPELLLESSVMIATQSRDVTSLLKFGANAVQAAAQIFRGQSDPVTCLLDSLGDVELQGLAVLKLNGVDVQFPENLASKVSGDQLVQFATGDNPAMLMRSSNLFLKELACLRGVENPLRHQVLLDTAFDRDEQLVFDVINHLRDSSYF